MILSGDIMNHGFSLFFDIQTNAFQLFGEKKCLNLFFLTSLPNSIFMS